MTHPTVIAPKIQGKIESIAFGGNGVLRHEGQVIFIPFTAPGDDVEAKILVQKKNFAYGQLLQLHNQNPLRTEPSCPYFGSCGGCGLQHLSYSAQIEAKRRFIIDALKRIGKIEIADLKLKMTPAKQQWNYRRHIRLKLKNEGAGFIAGYTSIDNTTLIPVTQCPIFLAKNDPFFARLQSLLSSFSNEGIQEAFLRLIKTEDEKILLAFRFSPHLPKNISIAKEALSHFSGIFMDSASERKQWGNTDCQIQLLDTKIHFSPFGFLQNHPEQSENLYRAILNALPAVPGKILDLYCGIGLTSLLFSRAQWVPIGVESHAETVKLAKENAAANQLNIAYFEGAAETLGSDLLKKEHPDAVLCNPPRTGLHPHLIQALLKEKPPCLLYVSCMPGTLARDLQKLIQGGYRIDHIEAFDMFPQTTHVETLVRLIH